MEAAFQRSAPKRGGRSLYFGLPPCDLAAYVDGGAGVLGWRPAPHITEDVLETGGIPPSALQMVAPVSFLAGVLLLGLSLAPDRPSPLHLHVAVLEELGPFCASGAMG